VTLAKIYKLKPNEIAPIALGRGGCLASDRFVVDGVKVGLMYRETPSRKEDSGWRFLAGDEDPAYMANPDLHGVYNVNTIANYDPDIMPFLDSETASCFERDETGSFRQIHT